MNTPRIPTRLFDIIGYPLGHTMSPPLHNTMLEQQGLDGVFMAWPTTPESLGDFIAALRLLPISGLSVTLPHKEEVMKHLDHITDRAKVVGAVNTLFWRESEVVGDNTDLVGFVRPLREKGFTPQKALVLGAGGAARAVLAGLQEVGAGSIVLTNRSEDRARALGKEFRVDVVVWEDRTRVEADLIVNSTPLGMAGELVDSSPWPRESFSQGQVVYDLVYNPITTRFLAEAEQEGCITISGVAMFTGQAAEQFRLWTGQDMDLALADKLVARLIEG